MIIYGIKTCGSVRNALKFCKDNNIIVFSDEIHSDLIYEPNKHIPFSSLNGAKDITITAFGVGKTFNMAGFAISSVATPDETLRKRFKEQLWLEK